MKWTAENGRVYDENRILVADCCCGERPVSTAEQIVSEHADAAAAAEAEEEIRVGDVVQILDVHNADGTRAGWVGAFVLVEEVKSWGIQGFVHAIQEHSESARIYIRLKWEHIKRIGRAEMVPQDVEVKRG